MYFIMLQYDIIKLKYNILTSAVKKNTIPNNMYAYTNMPSL